MFEVFGKRIKDGKCAFCGCELQSNKYCDCPKAESVNRFFKKFSKKIGNIRDFENLDETAKSAYKSYISPYVKTPKKFEGMTFDSYIAENQSQQNALKIVTSYYNNAFKHYISGMNLFLFGNYGTGKTMLMSILCRSLAKDYLFKCRYVNTVDLMNEIKESFNSSNDKTVKKILDDYRESDVLFLDDIDKVKPSDYLKEIFYAISNYRTEYELPTIISANHSPEELDSKFFDEAIISRLVDVNNSKIVHFVHNNKRLGG